MSLRSYEHGENFEIDSFELDEPPTFHGEEDNLEFEP